MALVVLFRMKVICVVCDFDVFFFCLFQLSELEQRVLEAEGRAEEAEDKVHLMIIINFLWSLSETASRPQLGD